jgi:hypothetical protein
VTGAGFRTIPSLPEPYTGNSAFQVVHGVLQVANRADKPLWRLLSRTELPHGAGAPTRRPGSNPDSTGRISTGKSAIEKLTLPCAQSDADQAHGPRVLDIFPREHSVPIRGQGNNCSAIDGLLGRPTTVAFGELGPRDAGTWQRRLLVAGAPPNRLYLLETSMLPVDTLVDECGDARIG